MVLVGGDKHLSLQVPLAIGTLQWGTTWIDEKLLGFRIKDEDAAKILRLLARQGVTLFDTAEGYGGGTSEERLGVLRSQDPILQKSMLLASKFLPTWWRFSKHSFEAALRASLKRLGIDCMPIFFLHSPVHPRSIEFWVECAAECKKKGLLHSFGLSNCNADQVRRAVAAGKKFGVKVSCNQVMMSLLDFKSKALQDTLAACKENNVTVLAYSPIGQGLLTDKLTRDLFAINRPAKMMRLNWDEIQPLRAAIKEVAAKHEKTMAQIAINWVICKGCIPLVGCRKLEQAQDIVGCLGWELDNEDLQKLDSLALGRSTLEGSTLKRGFFVFLAGVLMLSYRAAIVFNLFFGTGTNRF